MSKSAEELGQLIAKLPEFFRPVEIEWRCQGQDWQVEM
jgi:hypothetical protein